MTRNKMSYAMIMVAYTLRLLFNRNATSLLSPTGYLPDRRVCLLSEVLEALCKIKWICVPVAYLEIIVIPKLVN